MTNQENRASAFRTDCRLVNMKQEYPGYTGKAKWMLVSSLPESEVMERYADELKPYMPFIYVTREVFAPIAESHHNDRKHEIRDAKLRDAFPYEDGMFETFHEELVCDPFSESDWSLLYEANDQLTAVQKERIHKRFFLQLNMVEIAAEEGTTKQAVEKSIKLALAAIKKFMNQG